MRLIGPHFADGPSNTLDVALAVLDKLGRLDGDIVADGGTSAAINLDSRREDM